MNTINEKLKLDKCDVDDEDDDDDDDKYDNDYAYPFEC